MLYIVGAAKLWSKAGMGHGVGIRQAGLFAAGWICLAAALVSPLHGWGELVFSAHMLEHELLMTIAAPLLVLARPAGAVLWGLPRSMRSAAGSMGLLFADAWAFLTIPLTGTIVHGAAVWIWHWPALFEAALVTPAIHRLQHVSFIVTADLFWWALLQGRARVSGYGPAIFYYFVTTLHTGFLGVLLALARRPLYPVQTEHAALWDLTPLEDQQLAGMIMWIPAGLVYTIAALAFAGIWISTSAAHSYGELDGSHSL